MSDIFSVARYILDRLRSTEALKLQKLAYYSQAWSLAWTGHALFPQQFQAWANGPVCRILYDAHWRQYMVSAKDIQPRSELTDSERRIVDSVIEFYGSMTPQQLSDQTHSELPWIAARRRDGARDGERSEEIIDQNEMREYYSKIARSASTVSP